MPTTSGLYGITYEEYVEGYREAWRTDGNEAVRILQCNWTDRQHFMFDMLGYPTNLGDGSIARSTPEPHPDLKFLFAAEAEMIQGQGVPGQDSATQLINYSNIIPGIGATEDGSGLARFAVTYRAFPYDIKEDDEIGTELDRYVERRQTFATEAFPIPGTSLQWDSDSKPIQEPIPKSLYTKEVSYIWYEVPGLPNTNIQNCINKANIEEFDGYDIGTLLMIAPDIVRKRSAIGLIVWEITYKFLWRPQTWNFLYRRSAGDFELVKNSVGGKPAIYDLADFGTLFELD